MKINCGFEEISKAYMSLNADIKLHCEIVAKYTQFLYRLCMENNLFPGMLVEKGIPIVNNAVKYHDIGLCVRDDYKKLNSSNNIIYEKHVASGIEILEQTNVDCLIKEENMLLYQMIWCAIAHHHERYDGSGFPKKLSGNAISPIGQMCGLCDYYDQLSSIQLYQSDLSHFDALDHIEEQSGKLFNAKDERKSMNYESIKEEKLDSCSSVMCNRITECGSERVRAGGLIWKHCSYLRERGKCILPAEVDR
ncbi:HD-GYP domain-containing protein [Eubacterium sp.]|uniref:HD-GYP domain-containing protein n=1 Tax=Eubacterium sp. TaxID=142586 RepID=UPI002FC969F3